MSRTFIRTLLIACRPLRRVDVLGSFGSDSTFECIG